MRFFFVRDHRRRFRYFSSDPLQPIPAKFSRSKEAWELAKKKLMILPYRMLRREQAFQRALEFKGFPLPIVYSGAADDKKIHLRFMLFLQRQRTIHILILIGEGLLLPLSGLAALIPGPNIFFYALALLMITQWQALRGINRTLKAEHTFIPDQLIASWENAVREKREERYSEILDLIGKEHEIPPIRRILWTTKGQRS